MSIRKAANAGGFVDEEQGGSIIGGGDNDEGNELSFSPEEGNVDLFNNLDQNINDYKITHQGNSIQIKIGTVYKKNKFGI